MNSLELHLEQQRQHPSPAIYLQVSLENVQMYRAYENIIISSKTYHIYHIMPLKHLFHAPKSWRLSIVTDKYVIVKNLQSFMIFTEAFLLFISTFWIWTVVQVFIDVVLYENHTIVKVHIVWNLPQHSMRQRMFGLTRSEYEVCLSHIFYLIKLIYSHIPNSYILSYINRIYSHSHILSYIILRYHTHISYSYIILIYSRSHSL